MVETASLVYLQDFLAVLRILVVRADLAVLGLLEGQQGLPGRGPP